MTLSKLSPVSELPPSGSPSDNASGHWDTEFNPTGAYRILMYFPFAEHMVFSKNHCFHTPRGKKKAKEIQPKSMFQSLAEELVGWLVGMNTHDTISSDASIFRLQIIYSMFHRGHRWSTCPKFIIISIQGSCMNLRNSRMFWCLYLRGSTRHTGKPWSFGHTALLTKMVTCFSNHFKSIFILVTLMFASDSGLLIRTRLTVWKHRPSRLHNWIPSSPGWQLRRRRWSKWGREYDGKGKPSHVYNGLSSEIRGPPIPQNWSSMAWMQNNYQELWAPSQSMWWWSQMTSEGMCVLWGSELSPTS